MDTAKTIRSGFQKLYETVRTVTDITEEDLWVAFVRSGILEALGYASELNYAPISAKFLRSFDGA